MAHGPIPPRGSIVSPNGVRVAPMVQEHGFVHKDAIRHYQTKDQQFLPIVYSVPALTGREAMAYLLENPSNAVQKVTNDDGTEPINGDRIPDAAGVIRIAPWAYYKKIPA